VGIIHGLQGDTGVIAVEVAVLNQILDRINDLLMLGIILEGCITSVTDLLQQVRLFKTCFQHWKLLVIYTGERGPWQEPCCRSRHTLERIELEIRLEVVRRDKADGCIFVW
jgi:hypothetical protein